MCKGELYYLYKDWKLTFWTLFHKRVLCRQEYYPKPACNEWVLGLCGAKLHLNTMHVTQQYYIVLTLLHHANIISLHYHNCITLCYCNYINTIIEHMCQTLNIHIWGRFAYMYVTYEVTGIKQSNKEPCTYMAILNKYSCPIPNIVHMTSILNRHVDTTFLHIYITKTKHLQCLLHML